MGLSQTGAVRVLLINQVFHPDPQATSQYLSRLAEELVKRGHEVTVLAGRRDYDDPGRIYPERETWRGVEVIRVWNTGLGHGSKWSYAVDFFTFLLAASLRGLFLSRADLVVALTSPPLISVLGVVLARLWRARLVYWVMDLNPDEAVAIGWLKPEGGMTRFLEAVSRWTLQQAQRVIVLDVYMRDRLLDKGVAGAKIEVISLWEQGEAVFDAEKREQFRREHGLENKYVVMYAGNHTPCHPLDTLVEAARLLEDPRIHFAFVGFGTEWGKLRDRARAEQWKNASFLGFQPLATGLISAADLQVVVMGEPFVGIIHPCKVYNFLAAQRPFIYIGPERSHVTDLIREAGLGEVASSFRHGASRALADELRQKAAGAKSPVWPARERLAPWTEAAVLGKIVSALDR